MNDPSSTRRRFPIGEIIATIGVIGSLIFVGLEVRQNTTATEGATLQAISDMHTALLLEGSEDERFLELIGRVLLQGQTRRDFEPAEVLKLNRYFIAFLSHLENTYLQYRAGVVSDDVFESYGWKNRLWITPYFKEVSEAGLRVAVGPEFVEFFLDRLEGLGSWSPPEAGVWGFVEAERGRDSLPPESREP